MFLLFGLPIVFFVIVFTVLYLNLKFRFMNIFMFKHAMRALVFSGSNKEKDVKNKKTESPLKAFFIQASATLGLGNIAGSLFALYFGGAGTAIWVFIFGILLSVLKFNEITLGKIFRNVDDAGRSNGGAFYILSKGIGGKFGYFLGLIYAVCITLGVTLWSGFQLGQSVSTLTSFNSVFNFEAYKFYPIPLFLCCVILLCVFLILLGGIKSIADSMSKLVPLMVLIYFGLFCFVVFKNFKLTPAIFTKIFESAFDFKSMCASGFVVVLISLKRSILSTEAGLGTSSIPYANLKTEKYPAEQGFFGLLDVIMTSGIMSLGIILLMFLDLDFSQIKPNDLGLYLLKNEFSEMGFIFKWIFLLVIFCFSFTTLVGNGYYATAGARFLFPKLKYKIIVIYYVSFSFCFCILRSVFLVNIIDLLNYAMIMINLFGILKLSNLSKKSLSEYLEHVNKNHRTLKK